MSGASTKVLRLAAGGDDAQTVRQASQVLAEGGLVAFPTETVYGIGASIYVPEAVERVFEIKGRERRMPLSVAVASFEMMEQVASISEDDLALLRKVLPGPVTVLVKKDPDLPNLVTAPESAGANSSSVQERLAPSSQAPLREVFPCGSASISSRVFRLKRDCVCGAIE